MRFQQTNLWLLVFLLAYCALILMFHWRADLPLRLGVLTGAGFLLSFWTLSWVRTRAPMQVRQTLVGFLTPMACLCWGAALSPLSLFELFGGELLSAQMLALGLGPWTIAWAIGGVEFRSWVRQIVPRLAICAALTAGLFLVPHVWVIAFTVLMAIVLSWGWATYLAIVTGVFLSILSARAHAFLDQAAVLGRLSPMRVLVLKIATTFCLLLLVFPPWKVEERVWGTEEPGIQRRKMSPPWEGIPPSQRQKIYAYSPTIEVPPLYGPPLTRYEPWHMCFYRKETKWVGPDISGPAPLRRIPQNDDERVYVRYVGPNRRLSLKLGLWLIPLGLTAGLAAILMIARPAR